MKDNVFHIEGLSVETAFVYDFTSHGTVFHINHINKNKDCTTNEESFDLYTKEYFSDMSERMQKDDSVMICLDEKQTVLGVFTVSEQTWYNQDTKEQEDKMPNATEFVLICKGSKETLQAVLDGFHKSDVVRFKLHINYITTSELLTLIQKKMSPQEMEHLSFSKEYATVTQDFFTLKGELTNRNINKKYRLKICCSDGKDQSIRYHSFDDVHDTYEINIPLLPGANYIDCVVTEDQVELMPTLTSHIVFYKVKYAEKKEVIMWAEQYVNANVTDTKEKIIKLVMTAKEAGITAFALDVKGCEGYAAYKKTTRTKVPYMTESVNPMKKITMEIDFLEVFVEVAHLYGMKVYASFNFFVEGNIATQDFAIDLVNKHYDWAEVLHAPEDGNELVSVLKSKRNSMLCYVNPANQEVCDFELLRVQEVLDNYQVDGIIMDRTRYDNQFADFSEVTRAKFVEFLETEKKELKNWPSDVYAFDEQGSFVYGPRYLDFLTFRSQTIQAFAKRLESVVTAYRHKQNREIALAAYVGSWYDLYYQNGVNWGSKDFMYHERLSFPVPDLYTKRYSQTSYLDSIDFLMIGCYYETSEMIEKYITIGNIVTNHQIPVIGSVSLPHLSTQDTLNIGIKACLDYSEGTMIFDLCYTDWEKLRKAL